VVTILIIDDSELVRERVRRALSAANVGNDIILAEDGLQGIKRLHEHDVDLVLCDLVMPGIDGFKFIKVKLSKPQFGNIPVILLTGQEAQGEKVRGLRAGAADYITKPFDDEELVARVSIHLRLKQLQDELRSKNEQLETLSRTDVLTGIANRRHFMESLEREVRRARRYEATLSLIMADVDHFKQINDVHGHQVGDRALAMVSAALGASLREHDLLGRYGGEEFAIFLPETQIEGATVVAERARRQVEAARLEVGATRVDLTVSLGVSSFPMSLEDDATTLIHRADEALMRAKASGRNQVQIGT